MNEEKRLKNCCHSELVSESCCFERGFTLIELLVVVLIIGILAAIALPQYQKAVWRSRASEVKVFAKNLQDAQGIHRLNNATYAQDFSEMDIKL